MNTAAFKKLDLEHIPRRSRRRQKSTLKKFRPFVIAALVVCILLVVWEQFSSADSVFNKVFTQNAIKSTNGRVNILLLGIGGGNHDGADLTDSIIVASYYLSTHDVSLFSVPRDLYLPSIKEKINAAYELGKYQNGTSDTKRWLVYAEDKIDDILGIPLHYGVLMDFSSFSKAIDLVGGVDVQVPDTFDDYQYPIEGKENDLCGLTQQQMNITAQQSAVLSIPSGNQQVYVEPNGQVATDSATLSFPCRFMHIHFYQGLTHMDGATALEFVRSRHALGVEGSDFARSRRQQLVITAFREKALSVQTLSDPTKIAGLLNDLGTGVVTDIPQTDYPQMYTLFKSAKVTNSVVLGDLGNGKSLFINPPLAQYGGYWVLIPPNNDYSQVMQFVTNILNPSLPSPSTKKP